MMTTSPGRAPGISRAAARPGTPHRAVRVSAAACAAAVAGGIVLTACSTASPESVPAAHGAVFAPAIAGSAPAPAAPERGSAVSTTSLPLPGQDIIYTASLTVRVRKSLLQAQVAAAVRIAANSGGYTASEQMSTRPGTSVISAATLQLQIPVAGYQAAFDRLYRLGKPLAVSRQAQTVTTQVADVASRVASARAAIAQLRALLAHAGSVGALLSVQDQINSQESNLEALLAQQRSLAHQTSYATVTVQLLTAPVVRHPVRRHGFAAGIAAGWHALRTAVAAVLTAVGAALPFAPVAAVIAALLLGTRRQLRRRRLKPAPDA